MTSGFKRDGTLTDMSLLRDSDKEMDMSVISSSEDVKPCPARSHYSRTPTRVLNVRALVQTHGNRQSHLSYSGSEDSFQSGLTEFLHPDNSTPLNLEIIQLG